MKIIRQFLSAFVLLCPGILMAQTSNIYGKIVNDSNHAPMPVVGITVYLPDTSKQYSGVTDKNGVFVITNVPYGSYKIQASFVGFQTIITSVIANKATVNVGALKMKWLPTTITEAVVHGNVIPVEQKGDTTEFNADAYKTHPDATAEDLVNKMPGISSQTGSVTVNGEQVAQVLVDGEPFFGNDPTLALRNLPAEVIDKIQVFDKSSDQAQFTGVDDGQSQKTINIITKKNKRNGTFGKLYAGYGTDGRYSAGGNLNFFNGASRFSIIGLTNNVNQQNFSTEDLAGALGGGGGQGRGGQGRGGSGGGGMGAGGSTGGGYSQGANNFLVGQQGGITTTNSIGLNYTDAWDNNKIKLTASYFFNNSFNSNNTLSTTNYTQGSENSNVLNDTTYSSNSNYDQRLNIRLQWMLDSGNSIIATIKGTTQQTKIFSGFYEDDLLQGMMQSFSNDTNSSSNRAYDLSDNILFMHKFHKKGRTISLNLGSDVNSKNTPGNIYALNGFIRDTTLLNRQFSQITNGNTYSANLSYTEPIDTNNLLQFNYSPSLNINNTNKETWNYDSLTDWYTQFDTSLSNKYVSSYLTQLGGISYRFSKGKKFFLMLSANGQYSILSSQEQYPEAGLNFHKNYTAFVPRIMFNYRFSQSKNIRIMYRTNITPPSVSQLQNVVNNSNPLLLNTGNPGLRQDYEQNLLIRYGATNAKQGSTFLIYANASYIQNYVGNASYIPLHDTTFQGGIFVPKGSQLSMPTNLQGYINAKSFITYGRVIHPLKINMNLNGGYSFTQTPALINNVTNYALNYTTTGGVVISSNISEKVDFTLSYNTNYSQVRNTLPNQADDNYLSQVYSGKINLIILKGIVLNTGATETQYTGLSQAYNQSVFLWTGSIGYKFLKQQSLLISVSAFDILNQNKSITRTITDTYIQDSQTEVLKRYFMLNIQYNIRKFRTSPKPSQDSNTNTGGK